MRDRARWFLPTAVLIAALLPSPAAAADPAGPDPGAAARGAAVVNLADAVIPNTNHYKCYPVVSSTPFNPRRVLLRDQFWSTWAWVWRPHYLCNPVWKTTEDGNVYAPPDPNAHLVCYDITEDFPPTDWGVRTFDQFGWLDIKGNAAELLCLPADKYLISPPG